MEMQGVPASKMKSASIRLMFFILILGMIINNFLWIRLYIRSSVQYIGVFSQYLSKDEMIDCINHSLRNDIDIMYEKGITSLDMAGYRNAHAALMLNGVKLVSLVTPAVFILLGCLCLYLYKMRKEKTISHITSLIKWVQEGSHETKSFSYIPNELVEFVSDLKYRLERLSAIHEEDNQRLISYLEDISHQLKTPLAVIRAICEKNAEVNISVEADMNKCLDQVDKMNELIRHLLIMGRFECGKIRANFDEISPNDIMETIANDYELILHQKDISLEIIGNEDNKWLCDEFWIRQGIDNIISNAIKHSEAGGKIVIEYHSNSTENCIKIWDEGKGFENGAEEKIFNRFSSKDRTGKEGYGLGLAITKKAIELHLGTITARNRSPKGAEFYISIPKLDADTIFKKREMSH